MTLAERTPFRFPATPRHCESALRELTEILVAAGFERRARYNAEVVFEEIVMNICRYGWDGPAPPDVEVGVEIVTDAIVLVFSDNGIPFNPCEYPEPEFFSAVMSAKVGGLGISLVRKASTGMTYERTPKGENRLTVTVAAR
jgi:serine/threonine-protein kinase RsbW